MSGYRLTILRRTGWIRLGVVGAIAMIPITLMERALGFFSDGEQGLIQALQFLGGGVVLWLIVGFLANWVVRGFAIRSRPVEEDRDEPRSLAPRVAPARAPDRGSRP
jgi:hypothetical protein